MENKKTIWHLGAWNRNYGDHVLQASIRENILSQSEESIDFVPVDCQNTHFHEDLIEVMNKEADLLLVGGGGLIFNRSADQSLSGWQFSIKKEDIKKIKIPIVIYGIGYNKFHFDNRPFREGIREHLKEIQSVAAIFSVRNQGTKDQLIAWGLNPNKITVVPDAGSFLRANTITLDSFSKDKMKIGVNWVSDRPQFTYPEPYENTKFDVVKNVAYALKKIVKKYDAQIINLEHILGLDDDVYEVVKEILGENIISIQNDEPKLFPPSLVYAPFLMDIYKQMDLVIGMRGHANIIPFGMNTPFIAMGSHNKNRFFLDEVEETYHINLRNYPESTEVGTLVEMIEEVIKKNIEIKERMSKKYIEVKKIFDQLNKDIVQILKERP